MTHKFLIYLAIPVFLACNVAGNVMNKVESAFDVVDDQDSIKIKGDERGYIVKTGDMAPDFELVMADGSKKRLSSLRGKVVMLQFTASWCGVCRKEMPYIESDIWLKNKNRKDFALFAIDYKETKEKAIEFADKIGITYPMTLDLDGKIFDLFCSKGAGVTRNIIIDRKGKIIMLTRLFDMDEFNKMREVIENELKKKK